ncbi:MAG TPA: FAD-dependent oxidoreductase [Chitinophagaceae bacterium]|nr:FAD-dependent oxidoreductase [Chitinophagaceae bacterium]
MISRDGYCTSLWQDHARNYKTKNLPDHEKIYDVIIVGGGITGITTALLLQEAGKQCLVIEAQHLCFGTTGGTTAHINTLLDTPYTTISKNFSKEAAQKVASAAREAINLIHSNVRNRNINCGYHEADAYLFAQDDKQDAELVKIFDAARDAGLEVYHANAIPIPIECTSAIQARAQARFNPIPYVYALAEAFEQAGGVIVQQCRVIGVEENEKIETETTQGNFYGRALVYATHIPPGVNLVHLRCIPFRSYAMAVTLKDNEYPSDLVYDMYDPYHYYRTQEVNGETYLIVGGEDHKTAHDNNESHRFLALEAHIRHHFHVKEVAYQWSSQYFEPADGLPYIGHLPGHTGNIFVATGFGGNGMTYSHVAALLLKHMLLNEDSPYISLFDPNRLKPVAGFVNFIKHNADVIKQFAGKFFSGETIEELVELAPGEGKIVKLEGHKVGLYKDPSGHLHAINPICTHLKCEVKWNNAELTWDCPCHGARYSCDGKLLTGPADHDLEPIEIRTLIEK